MYCRLLGAETVRRIKKKKKSRIQKMWFVSKDSEKYKRPTKPTFIFLLLLKKLNCS